MSDSDIDLELKQVFLEEATQIVSEIERCFLALEVNPNDRVVIETLFRLAHNLKGSAKAVGFSNLGGFTHELESFLLKIKSGALEPTSDVINLLLRCNDSVRDLVDGLKANASYEKDNSDLIHDLKSYGRQPAPEGDHGSSTSPGVESSAPSEPAPRDAVEIWEDIPAVAPSPAPTQPRVEEIPAPPVAVKTPLTAAPAGNADESIRVSAARLDRLLNFVGEMAILQSVLKEQTMQGNLLGLRRTVRQLGKVSKEIQDISMGLRMLPIKQTFQKMQRIVRDTASALSKKVNLHIEGEETELDKTILELIGDPLVHLIRNAVDHGIESPEDRLAHGKSEFGTISLRAFQQSGKLVVEVKDDGAGIDGQSLLKKAIEKGIVRPGASLSMKEATNLIFHPGFSTKAQVTEVSGRGVGMDVVKTNIEKLQGEVVVSTVIGSGTVFKIVLPLTLAIVDGMIIMSGGERFVIPLQHVHESLKLGPKDSKKTGSIGDVLLLRGETLPLYNLKTYLGKRKGPSSAGSVEPAAEIAIVIRTQEQPFAVLVDDIVGQSQVVIKKLSAEFHGLRGFSGSAILGDGRPALILELGELVGHRRMSA